MVIRDGRVHAAGCFLPLSNNYDISRTLGTRHRAALGMSEVSDALIVIVSEETGAISVAKDGKLNLRLTVNSLNSILCDEPAFRAGSEERQRDGYADEHFQEKWP